MEHQDENKFQEIIFNQSNTIDELEKRIRLIELNNKKRVIELENELKNEQRRAIELEDELKKNICEQSDYEHIKLMSIDLQAKLTEHENFILEQKQKEHQLNKQIRTLKEQINSASHFASPYGRLDKQYISPSQHDDCRNVECFDESNTRDDSSENDKLKDIDKNDLIRALLDLKNEKDDLEQQLLKIKEGAIEAIMEKERTIIELREQLFDKDEMDCVNMKLDNIMQEKDEWQQMHSQVIEGYEKTIQELQQRIDFEQRQFEERMFNLESEVNNRVFLSFQQNLDSAKDVENNLIQQLNLSEERIKMCEKTIADQNKIIQNNKDQMNQYIEEIANFKQSLAQSKTFKEKINSLEKDLVNADKNHRKEVDQKQENVDKLTRRVNELLKNCVSFESENKSLIEMNDQMNIKYDKAQQDIDKLRQKLDDQIVNYERDLQIQQQYFNEEKNKLLQETCDQKIDTKSNRQSCLKNDIGYDKYSSCFDSPYTGNRKRDALRTKSQQKSVKFYNNSEYRCSEEDSNSDHEYEKENDFFQQLDKYQDNQSSRYGVSSCYSDVLQTPECNNDQREGQMLLRDITTTINNKQSVNFHALNQSLPEKPSHKQCIKLQPINRSTPNKAVIEKENHLQLIAPLKQEIDHLNNINEKLQTTAESYENEIIKLQNELKAAYKQMQECRKTLSDNINLNKDKESSLKCEIESLKTHIYKIETHMITYKLQYEEDNSYLKEELKITERIAAESKVKVAQIMQDKDYFQQKYKSILAKYNSKKNKSSQSNSYLRQNDNYQSSCDSHTNLIVF